MAGNFKVLYLGSTDGFEAVRETLPDSWQLVHVEADAGEVSRQLSTADGLIDASMKTRLTAELLDNAKRLRIVSCATTGADHIDAAALEARGGELRTLREDRALLLDITPAAELSWTLLMACARRLPAAAADVRAGQWDRTQFPGVMLNGRTLGVIGCGRIGTWMSRYARAFGMTVLGHDPFLEEFPTGVEPVDILALARGSDFVSVHVHLTDETRHLVSRQVFAEMKPGVIFVNTSRADVADEQALLEGLESGRVAAAGLDVLSGEPDIESSPLLAYARRHDNLIITPHCGGFSPDAVRVVCRRAAEKVLEKLSS